VQEPDVVASTQGGGGWAKHEDEDVDGDAGAVCGVDGDVEATRAMGVDVRASCGAGWGPGTARGMATVSKVPATEDE
jgi:hypothetical protein